MMEDVAEASRRKIVWTTSVFADIRIRRESLFGGRKRMTFVCQGTKQILDERGCGEDDRNQRESHVACKPGEIDGR